MLARIFLTPVILIQICLLVGPSVLKAATVEGEWVPPGGDTLIHITVGNSAELRIVRTLGAQIDSRNPDKALRTRSLDGALIGDGFAKKGARWVGGQIYDPASGKTYRGQFELLDDNHLSLRGYVGLPVLGRSEIWTRRVLFESQIDALLGRGEGK